MTIDELSVMIKDRFLIVTITLSVILGVIVGTTLGTTLANKHNQKEYHIEVIKHLQKIERALK